MPIPQKMYVFYISRVKCHSFFDEAQHQVHHQFRHQRSPGTVIMKTTGQVQKVRPPVLFSDICTDYCHDRRREITGRTLCLFRRQEKGPTNHRRFMTTYARSGLLTTTISLKTNAYVRFRGICVRFRGIHVHFEAGSLALAPPPTTLGNEHVCSFSRHTHSLSRHTCLFSRRTCPFSRQAAWHSLTTPHHPRKRTRMFVFKAYMFAFEAFVSAFEAHAFIFEGGIRVRFRGIRIRFRGTHVHPSKLSAHTPY